MIRKIFFHPERCMLCHSCVLACEMDSLGVSDPREIPRHKMPHRRLRITFSRGTPWVWRCQHCSSAPCVEACVTGSLVKDAERGVIHHPETCIGCGSCILACPYGVLRYDEREERVSKCNLCLDKEIPPCVGACQTRALVFEDVNSFVQTRRKRMAVQIGASHAGGR
jgi:anaerobic carbon-monoxide dehydrogenase iron sulfur subunit